MGLIFLFTFVKGNRDTARATYITTERSLSLINVDLGDIDPHGE